MACMGYYIIPSFILYFLHPAACLWPLFIIYSQTHDWLIASLPPNYPYHRFFLMSSTPILLNASFLLGHAVTFAWNSLSIVTLLRIPTLTPCQLSSFISHNPIQTPCPSPCKISWSLLCGPCPHLDFCYCTYKNVRSSCFHRIVYLCWTMVRNHVTVLGIPACLALEGGEDRIQQMSHDKHWTMTIGLCNVEVIGDLCQSPLGERTGIAWLY